MSFLLTLLLEFQESRIDSEKHKTKRKGNPPIINLLIRKVPFLILFSAENNREMSLSFGSGDKRKLVTQIDMGTSQKHSQLRAKWQPQSFSVSGKYILILL